VQLVTSVLIIVNKKNTVGNECVYLNSIINYWISYKRKYLNIKIQNLKRTIQKNVILGKRLYIIYLIKQNRISYE